MRLNRLMPMLAVVLAMVATLQAAPIPVTNGSFETGTGNAASFTNFIRCFEAGTCGFTPDVGGIDGWFVIGEVDYMESFWTAQDGVRSVDLNGGTGPGGIATIIPTVVGRMYQISFYLAGNPDGDPVTKSMAVLGGDAMGMFTFDTTGRTHADMGWTLTRFTFTATATESLLGFVNIEETGFGAAVDNVSVVEVIPEPASLLLLGTGIFALAGLGRFLRKR